ncbi:dihydrofolate reductase [Clostridiaceae bacterium OttesenSCG-928-D20]|nr:dihydrofolate reductase [Clostridiaceae bacterium OttesenSCG-928-D20]
MDAIVAVYSDWGIGRDGTQPVFIPEDRKYFRELTKGASVIVGRKTLEDFPGKKPLPNRRNIILSRSAREIEGAELAATAEDAVRLVSGEKCFVIGGASVYRVLLKYCNRVYVTFLEINPGSDVFFPNLDEMEEWVLLDPGEERESEGVKYRFAVYGRSGASQLGISN